MRLGERNTRLDIAAGATRLTEMLQCLHMFKPFWTWTVVWQGVRTILFRKFDACVNDSALQAAAVNEVSLGVVD